MPRLPFRTGGSSNVKRLALLLLFLAPSASGYELLDRVQLREKAVGKDESGRIRYTVVASLAPLNYFHAPLLQVYPLGGGGGGIISGVTPIIGGATTQVCFNLAGVISCGDADFTFASDALTLGYAAGAGTGATVLNKTMSGASTSSNFLSVTGTLPTTLSAETRAINYQITTAGSSSQLIVAHKYDLLAGYTGASGVYGGWYQTAVNGTGANAGVVGGTSNNTAGRAVGVVGFASTRVPGLRLACSRLWRTWRLSALL
jgi:hypothetical protein